MARSSQITKKKCLGSVIGEPGHSAAGPYPGASQPPWVGSAVGSDLQIFFLTSLRVFSILFFRISFALPLHAHYPLVWAKD